MLLGSCPGSAAMTRRGAGREIGESAARRCEGMSSMACGQQGSVRWRDDIVYIHSAGCWERRKGGMCQGRRLPCKIER
jgi:hypothetical protein